MQRHNPAFIPRNHHVEDALQAATGASFDQLYVRIMLQGHRQALQLHQGYAASGDNDDLKKFALDVTKVVERHLNHITEITKKLNVSNAG